MWIYLSLLVCLVGLIMYILNSPPHTGESSPRRAVWAEVGRIMFGFGLLVFLLTYHGPGSTINFLR